MGVLPQLGNMSDNKGLEMSEQNAILNSNSNNTLYTAESKTQLHLVTPPVVIVPIKEKLRTYKNLIMASLAILFHYASFYALANLQSSIHQKGGLGNYSLAIIYAGKLVSNLFFATTILGLLGCKNSILICTFFFIFYTAANFKPDWYRYTMIPAALISGLAGGPQMVAVKSYIAILAKWYADLTKSNNYVAITSQFYGIYYMFYGSAEIWGNIMSKFVLHESENKTILGKNNITCGANYCPFNKNDNQTNLVPPEEYKIFILCGVCIGFEMLALFFPFFFLDRLKNDRPAVKPKFLSLLLKALRQMKKPKQLILIPILIFRGLQDGFVVADFNLAFVSCTLGIEYIGTVNLCLGLVKSISSFLLGLLIRVTGRMAVYLGSIVVTIISLLLMLLWNPDPEMPAVIYIMSALLAISDGVIYSQTLALHSTIFHDNHEAAFSNCAVFQYVGHITAYVTSNYLCVAHKIYLLMVVLVFGTVGYIYVEIQEIKKARRNE